MSVANETRFNDAEGYRELRIADLGLGQAAGHFLREESPRTLVVSVLALFGTRVALGAWTWVDLLAFVIVFSIQPLVEWVIHVHVLHFEPRTVASRTVDLEVAAYHRAHHVEPWDLRYVPIPRSALFFGTLFFGGIWWLAMPSWPTFCSAMTASALGTLSYEWVHFLIHTSYKPKGRIYRRMWRFHRLHHYKNEKQWFGVTRHLADRLLGTMPDPETIEKSVSARRIERGWTEPDA